MMVISDRCTGGAAAAAAIGKTRMLIGVRACVSVLFTIKMTVLQRSGHARTRGHARPDRRSPVAYETIKYLNISAYSIVGIPSGTTAVAGTRSRRLNKSSVNSN